MISCDLFVEQLSEYIDGELSPAATTEQTAHLQSCGRCRLYDQSVRKMLGMLGAPGMFEMPAETDARLRESLRTGIGEPLVPKGPLLPAAMPSRPEAAARTWWFTLRPMLVAAAMVLLVIFGVFRYRAGAVTTSGWLIDAQCYTRYVGHFQDHPRTCLINPRCYSAGYGIINASGQYLRFDAKGNQTALAALQASSQDDHIWVTVHARKGPNNSLKVQQLELTQPLATASVSGGDGFSRP